MRSAIACAAALAGLVTVAWPAGAGADATVASENSYSQAQGLPDGRVYEQVSPADKSGYAAGRGLGEANPEEPPYSLARADGDAIEFGGNGPIGEALSGDETFFLAGRSQAGWRTRSLLPRANAQGPLEATLDKPFVTVPAPDLSHTVFTAFGSYFSPGDPAESSNVYLAGEDPRVQPQWLGRPLVEDPLPALGQEIQVENIGIAGGSSDLSTVYFDYPGTLLAQDAPRARYIELVSPAAGNVFYGFYEWRDGTLSEAGTLPEGGVDPYGAVAAADFPEFKSVPAYFDNQVSQDGSRAFFVSPYYHALGQGEGLGVPCREPVPGGCVPQLYVHETRADGSQRSVLVSRDELLPAVPVGGGEYPARAPHGVLSTDQEVAPLYAYASPDGSHVFFQSVDALTEPAEEAHGGPAPKAYVFDTQSETLAYLPGVGGYVLASSQDGNRLLFEDREQLYLWSAEGSPQGLIRAIAPGGPPSETHEPAVTGARATPDGSVFVFATSARIPGFNDDGVHQEIYRYDVAAGALDCVSCPPAGVSPRGNAVLDHWQRNKEGSSAEEGRQSLWNNRGLSQDGSRVFFDTPDPLVARDANGTRDVYEWEDGTVYLLSSGTSSSPSSFLDSGADGADAFFIAADGLAAGDRDGAYDVYDARIPHPGDGVAPAAATCKGSVCQGPPSIAPALAAPASSTFFGPAGSAAAQTAVAKPGAEKRTAKHRPKRRRKRRRARGRRAGAGAKRAGR